MRPNDPHGDEPTTDPIPFSLHSVAHDLTNRSIMISGPARSGTRILGSLFFSLRETEYLFEPPMLYSLIPLIDRLPEREWRLLFETYLVEEFLLNAMAGRFLNFNEHDYSNILMSKSRDEVAERMARTHTRIEDLKEAPSRQIVAKIPDLTIWLEKMAAYYPQMTVIVMLRKPESVIGSFFRKGWFSDELLRGPMNYPPYKRRGDFFLSYLVADEDTETFIHMSEVERCAYYYYRAYQGIPDDGNVIIIDYDDFVRRPREIFLGLCEHLGGRFGAKTESVLDMVKEPRKSRDFSWEGVSPHLEQQVYEVAHDLKRRVTRFSS